MLPINCSSTSTPLHEHRISSQATLEDTQNLNFCFWSAPPLQLWCPQNWLVDQCKHCFRAKPNFNITKGKKAEISHMLLYQRMKMFPDKNIWCYARDQNDWGWAKIQFDIRRGEESISKKQLTAAVPISTKFHRWLELEIVLYPMLPPKESQ